jgi:hypothetical protein
MNTFLKRIDALTGSACLKKAIHTLHLDKQSTHDGHTVRWDVHAAVRYLTCHKAKRAGRKS